MTTLILMVAAGLGLLLAGGEAMVRGAVALGRWLHLSPLVVGIIIIGFATSLPEMVVSVQAVRFGVPEIATGNILGSNIANILLVLGLTALVKPMHHQARALTRDAAPLLISALVFLVLGATGIITRVEGALLFGALMLLMLHEFRRARRETQLAREIEEELEEEMQVHPWLQKPPVAALVTIAGLALLVYGGDLFVKGASGIAEYFGVSHGLIGLTLVALGTSSPELASSLVAARHGHSDVAYGNVVGSNLFNVLGVGGAAALAGGLVVPERMLWLDGSVMMAATIAMIVIFASRAGLTRLFAALFAASYVGYIAVRAGIA